MATNSNENNIVKRDGIDSATDSISSEINHQHANLTANRHVELGKSIVKNPLPPLHKAVFTSTKVLMAAFTVRGIESEITALEDTWPVWSAKELMDNPFEWLNDFYPDSPKQDRKIILRVWPIDIGVRIAVRNSNVDNITVFENLALTFDFGVWYSSKRNQHKGGPGAQGDALKRIFKMGYASWTSGYGQTVLLKIRL